MQCRNPEINRDKLEQIVLDRLTEVLFNPKAIPSLVSEYNAYIADKNGSAKERVSALRDQLQSVRRKIDNAVNLMIETGSASFKNKLKEFEETKEKLEYEFASAEAEMAQCIFSEDEISRLFNKAKRQLKSGTLATRRKIIDQYVNKVVIHPDRIEVYMNLMLDYVVKEVVAKG